jgi:hypothetical protein
LQSKPKLTDKDTIVLADFVNKTGDPVFDGTLRQGLAVQLEQPPFLSLISEDRIRKTLGLMGQQADAQLTPDIGREIWERIGSTAVLHGSIASLGSQYVLGLRATACRSGDILDEEQAQATSSAFALFGNLYPVYVRGLAYLGMRDGPGAAAEFRKIIAHRNIVANDPIGALAHVQLGRALVLSGDAAGAKTAYQDFLTLWKDADTDIPMF